MIARVDGLSLPRWLADRPHQLAAWLQLRNAARRSWLRWVAALAVMAALAWGGTRPALLGFLRRCSDAPMAVTLVAAALGAVGTLQRKQRLADREHAWLSALPVRERLAERVALAPLAALLLLALELLMATLAHLPVLSGARILGCCALGVALGFGIGWALPQRPPNAQPGSWYATVHRAHGHSPYAASLLPLGYWPVAHSRIWARPKIVALAALVVLLGVPLGTPASRALTLMAAVLVGWHLAALQGATLRVSPLAARWLTPTPLGLAPFTASLLYLSWLKQLSTCALVVVAAAVLARPAVPDAIRGSLAWMALAMLAGVVACTGTLGRGRAPAADPRGSR